MNEDQELQLGVNLSESGTPTGPIIESKMLNPICKKIGVKILNNALFRQIVKLMNRRESLVI